MPLKKFESPLKGVKQADKGQKRREAEVNAVQLATEMDAEEAEAAREPGPDTETPTEESDPVGVE